MVWCWQARAVPVPLHGFEVLQLKSSTSASAETFLRCSLCFKFSSGDMGMEPTPALGSGSWMGGCVGWMGRNMGAYSHAHGDGRACGWKSLLRG